MSCGACRPPTAAMACENRYVLTFPDAKALQAVMTSPGHTFVVLDSTFDVDILPDEFTPFRNAAGVLVGFSVPHDAFPITVVRSCPMPCGLMVTVAQTPIERVI